MTSPELCRPLLGWLALRPGPMVEIGPGGGVLTHQLADLGPLLAVEFDPDWAFSLQDLGSEARVVVADARDLAWERMPADGWVVGNLPYNLSTVLIEAILDRAPNGTGLAFLVQLEVARRLSAAPGSSDYGSLSVIAQARCSWRLLARVRPGSFRPPPKVESAFVGSEPLETWNYGDWSRFKSFVRAAFGRRRKTLVNSLRGVTSSLPWGSLTWSRPLVELLLERVGRDSRSRAEQLAVGEYLQLWQYLASDRAATEMVDDRVRGS